MRCLASEDLGVNAESIPNQCVVVLTVRSAAVPTYIWCPFGPRDGLSSSDYVVAVMGSPDRVLPQKVFDNGSAHKALAVQRLAYSASQIRSALHPDQRIFPESGGALVFQLITRKLRRGTHTSVRQFNADIQAWVDT